MVFTKKDFENFDKKVFRRIPDDEGVSFYFGDENLEEMSLEEKEQAMIHVSGKYAREFFKERDKKVLDEKMAEMARKCEELGIEPDELTVKQAVKREKKTGRGVEFLQNFKKVGGMSCLLHGSTWTLEAIEEAFRSDGRFHGRVPQIADIIASVSDKYRIPAEKMVQRFDISLVKSMRDAGVPDAEVALLYATLQKPVLEKIKSDKRMLRKLANVFSESILDENDLAYQTAVWVAVHYGSDEELLDKMLENPSKFRVGNGTNMETVRVQEVRIDALNEIKKLEKAYKKPGFKFSECRCDMAKTEVEKGRYKAKILDGDDPRQVMLGYETSCCQHLGDAGETAMMHGLLNPKAGFFVITDKNTGKLRAQAEVWEADDETIVFDNIEFADDTEIDRYREILGEWLVESKYRNAYMGCGYNALGRDRFERIDDIIPPVTARELYVMSYEEDAEIPDFEERTAPEKRREDTNIKLLKLKSEEEAEKLLREKRIDYYDYVYSDVDDDKGLVWLKKDYEVAPWFEVDRERMEEKKALYGNEGFMERIADYAEVLTIFKGKKNGELEEPEGEEIGE